MTFFNKYIKYKNKYLKLKYEQSGGALIGPALFIASSGVAMYRTRKIFNTIETLETNILNFIGSKTNLKNKDDLSQLLKNINKLIQDNSSLFLNIVEYDKLMLDNNFDLDITMNKFYDIFTKYYKNGTTEDSISTKMNKKCTNNCINCNALLVQCMWGNLDTIQLLIDNGSNINLKNEADESPLMAAILSKTDDKLDKIKLLADKGAKVNSYYINLAIDELLYNNNQDKKEETIELLINIQKRQGEK